MERFGAKMRRLGLAGAVLLALVAPGLLWARSVTVRSGEHADFSRVVVAGVDANWTWQATPQGGNLQAPDDVTFDLSHIFDLIPRTRLTDAQAQGAALSLTAAPGVAIAAERQGDIFVIDLSGQPAPGADPPPTASPPPLAGAPTDAAMRELGAITTLPGVGQTPQTASPQAQSIEQALLFRIAQAAGEGNLTVADRATLDALRRAGLIPPPALPAAGNAAPAAPVPGAPDAPAAVTCDAARAALTFPSDAPDSVQGYEQAYLAMDRRDNDPGLVDLARGYLSLALPDEGLAILSLRADPALPEARVLAAAAEALDQRRPSDAGLDLAALAECGPEVELWLLAHPGSVPPRSEAYALFQSLLALPGPLRQAMMARLRQTLPATQDSAAKTLLDLMAGLDPACTDPCPTDAAPLGAAVLSLSQLDRASLTQQAQAVFLRLLNSPAPLAIETARHLDAMSFERRAEAGGTLMRASALIAYARAGDFETALSKLAAFTPDDRHDPALAQAATAVATALAETSSDAEFLRLAFAHASTLASCCAAGRPALDARLAAHGFGPGGAQATADASPSAMATPTIPGKAAALAAAENHVTASDATSPPHMPAAAPPPSAAEPAAIPSVSPAVSPAVSPTVPPAMSSPVPPAAAAAVTAEGSGGSDAAASDPASSAVLLSPANSGPVATAAAPVPGAPSTAPGMATAAANPSSAMAAPARGASAENAPRAATAQDSALVAKSRDLTGASAALRSQVAASLAEVGLTAPAP